jgi:hypothetical protein
LIQDVIVSEKVIVAANRFPGMAGIATPGLHAAQADNWL